MTSTLLCLLRPAFLPLSLSSPLSPFSPLSVSFYPPHSSHQNKETKKERKKKTNQIQAQDSRQRATCSEPTWSACLSATSPGPNSREASASPHENYRLLVCVWHGCSKSALLLRRQGCAMAMEDDKAPRQRTRQRRSLLFYFWRSWRLGVNRSRVITFHRCSVSWTFLVGLVVSSGSRYSCYCCPCYYRCSCCCCCCCCLLPPPPPPPLVCLSPFISSSSLPPPLLSLSLSYVHVFVALLVCRSGYAHFSVVVFLFFVFVFLLLLSVL